MIKEKEIEEHYHNLSSETLHCLKDEFQWLLDNSILNTAEQIKFVNRTLGVRGEGNTPVVEKNLLIVCTCGHSRIIPVSCSDEQVKLLIFDEFMKPCEKCHQSNKYSWKYLQK